MIKTAILTAVIAAASLSSVVVVRADDMHDHMMMRRHMMHERMMHRQMMHERMMRHHMMMHHAM